MDIPFFVILIIYLIMLGGICILGFFNIYHMVRFGMFDFTGKLNTAVFICFSIAIVALTVLLLVNVPWFDTFRIADILDLPFSGSRNTLDL